MFGGRGSTRFDRETELRCELLQWSRFSKGSHTDPRAIDSDVPFPAESCRLLHGDSSTDIGRKHRLAISLVLVFKKLPGRHADHPRFDPLFFECLLRTHAKGDFASGTDDQDVGF